MASYGFHSEAAEEYLAATRYYLNHASSLVAAAFVAEVEGAIQTLLESHNMADHRGGAIAWGNHPFAARRTII